MSKISPTAIVISDSSIRLVQARSVRGQAHISTVLVQRLANDSDAEVLLALGELAKHKSVRSAGVCLVLPRHLAILKVLRLPSQDPKELRQMVEIQISSQTPYTLDEVEWDYRIGAFDEEGYTQVLLTVIPKEVSQRYIELANNAGIPLSGLTISSVGLLGWFRYQAAHNRLGAAFAVALCVIDQAHTEICFVESDKLIYSRSINVGLTELRSSPEEMIRQLSLSMKYYQSEKMGGDVSRFVVVADQIDLQDFMAQLELQLQMPCELITTIDGLTIPSRLRQIANEEDAGVALAAATGIQFLTTQQMVNLLPDTIRVSKQSKVLRRELIKLVVLAGCIYAAALSVWSVNLAAKESQVAQLRAAIAGLDPQIDGAKRKMKMIEFFDGYAQKRIFVPQIMSRLAKLIPEDISLRALYLNEKGLFTIQGYAQTREALNDFQAKLVNEPMFQKVNLEFATSRRIFNLQVTDFKFTSYITVGEE